MELIQCTTEKNGRNHTLPFPIKKNTNHQTQIYFFLKQGSKNQSLIKTLPNLKTF